jgi:hypothetical protein
VRAEAAAAACALPAASSPIDPVLVLHRSLTTCVCVWWGAALRRKRPPGDQPASLCVRVRVRAYVQEAGAVTKFCIGRRLSHVPVHAHSDEIAHASFSFLCPRMQALMSSALRVSDSNTLRLVCPHTLSLCLLLLFLRNAVLPCPLWSSVM